jgi:putative salt-induced outer membrane protein
MSPCFLVIKSTLLFSAFFLSFIVQGQSVVNTEDMRLDTLTEGLSGNVELGFNLVQNTNNVIQTQNSTHFQWEKGSHSIMSVNALNLTIFNESKVLNDGFQYLRYSYSLSPLFDIETFGQAQYNTIINIKGRYLTGLGARLHLLNARTDSLKLHVSAHYMREYEEETTGIINRHHRLNTILSFGWPIRENLSVNFIGYYQPDIVNFSDFRVSTEAGINIEIFERFTLKYAMAWFYDQNPPAGIRNIFYTFQNTLLFKL